MSTLRVREIQHFHSTLRKEGLDVPALIKNYCGYDGIMYRAFMGDFLQILNARLSKDGLETVEHDECFEAEGRLKDEFLSQYCPELLGTYYPAEDIGLPSTTILQESINQWRLPELPLPFNIRIGRKTRPSVEMYEATGGSLFIGPYGYQYFSEERGCVFPQVSSRTFSRSVCRYDRFVVDRPIILVQDRWDGTSFAHFLYDHVPRIIYGAQMFRMKNKRPLFIMGGEKTLFHELLIARLCDDYGVDDGAFYFVEQKRVVDIRQGLFFFSDQKMQEVHPLHMCHPQTLRLVRDLLSYMKIDKDLPRRLYISRSDAKMRCLINESVLFSKLKPLGFSHIVLSDFSVDKQIALMMSAEYVVAPHGMGLTNFVFNRRASKMTEIFCPHIGSDAFAFVAQAIGSPYCFLNGSISDERRLHFTVDVDQVLTTVEGNICSW